MRLKEQLSQLAAELQEAKNAQQFVLLFGRHDTFVIGRGGEEAVVQEIDGKRMPGCKGHDVCGIDGQPCASRCARSAAMDDL